MKSLRHFSYFKKTYNLIGEQQKENIMLEQLP